MNCFKTNLRVHLHLLSSGISPAVIYQLHGFKRDTTAILPGVALNPSLVMVKGFTTAQFFPQLM